ncbi:VOC family protein, partial [Klebsiella pneumoniae]|nr:VOC family protein [Klebsiella pneumoniae]
MKTGCRIGGIELKLLQVRLLVQDVKKCVKFYNDFLGLPISWYEEKLEYALFNNGETKIELFSRNKMAAVVGDELEGEAHSRFLLQFEVEDVDQTYNDLKENGIEFVNKPYDRKEWRARMAHFRDPDQNLIEIYQ